MPETFIIAEAGVNHNGDVDLALRMIEAARECGADAIKFQIYQAEKLVDKQSPPAHYQLNNVKNLDSQYTLLKQLELSQDAFVQLADFAKDCGIEFMASAFDTDSLNFLVSTLSVQRLKVGSGEITNTPFLLEHAQTGLPIILSTGMSNLGEVEQALFALAFGYLNPSYPESKEALEEAYYSLEALPILKQKLTLLHCTSFYPAPALAVNLHAIQTLKQNFPVQVGYSDHTEGIAVPLAAIGLGAMVIEKHFTMDKHMNGPDHKASLEVHEFKAMVEGIRQVECCLGTGIKGPQACERDTMLRARKSLVASRKIQVGEPLSFENVHALRPGSGLPPTEIWRLFNKASHQAYDKGQLLDE